LTASGLVAGCVVLVVEEVVDCVVLWPCRRMVEVVDEEEVVVEEEVVDGGAVVMVVEEVVVEGSVVVVMESVSSLERALSVPSDAYAVTAKA
jgi:hypothetical protein